MLEAIAPEGLAGHPAAAFALFFALAIGHVVGDFPLQGNFLAMGKTPQQWSGSDGCERYTWIYCLVAHSMIQAGAVWLITGSLVLGLVELVLHCIIDWAKSRGLFGLCFDQLLHFLCKIGYVAVLASGVLG